MSSCNNSLGPSQNGDHSQFFSDPASDAGRMPRVGMSDKAMEDQVRVHSSFVSFHWFTNIEAFDEYEVMKPLFINIYI